MIRFFTFVKLLPRENSLYDIYFWFSQIFFRWRITNNVLFFDNAFTYFCKLTLIRYDFFFFANYQIQSSRQPIFATMHYQHMFVITTIKLVRAEKYLRRRDARENFSHVNKSWFTVYQMKK